MKKESYTKKLNQLALEIKDVKSALKSDINGTIYGIERYGYIQISYNQVENDNYYYITVNDRLSDYYYTLTFKNGKILMAQRTELKFNNQEFTTTITINTFDKHFRNMIKNILKDVKTEKSLIDSRNKKAQKSDQVVALNVNNDNSDHLSIQVKESEKTDNKGDNKMTEKQFDGLTVKQMEKLTKNLSVNDCLDYITDLIDEYEIGYILNYEQVKTIYEYELNEQDLKEFTAKMKNCYNQDELNKEIIIGNMEMFNLDILTSEDIYIYESADDYLEYQLELYGTGAQEFYDNIICYLIDSKKIVKYISKNEYYPLMETDDGQLIQIFY